MNIVDFAYISKIESELIDSIKKDGEWDGNCHIGWLSKMNGVCDIECKGQHCTDVLGAYVGTDYRLSISVISADDKTNVFVGLHDLPMNVIEEIYRQLK